MKLHFTGVSSASRAESSPPSGNITAAVLSVNISATPSGQPHSSSYNVPVVSSHSLLTFPGFTATVPTANVTAASYSGSSSSVPVVNTNFVVLSNSQRPVVPSTNVPATTPLNSLQTNRSSYFHVASSSSVLQLSSSGPTLPPENTRSSALSRSHTPSGVPVVPSSLLILTLPSTNTSASDSIQTPLSVGVSVVSSGYVVLSSSLTQSSLGSSAISSSVDPIPPGIFVRFGINVPKNQSLNDGSFENQLREGIFSIYQNGSLDSSSRNFSVQVS